jgi:hypothetical protein
VRGHWFKLSKIPLPYFNPILPRTIGTRQHPVPALRITSDPLPPRPVDKKLQSTRSAVLHLTLLRIKAAFIARLYNHKQFTFRKPSVNPPNQATNTQRKAGDRRIGGRRGDDASAAAVRFCALGDAVESGIPDRIFAANRPPSSFPALK